MKGRGQLYAVLKDRSVISARNERDLGEVIGDRKVVAIFKGQRLGFKVEQKPAIKLTDFNNTDEV